MISLIAFLGNYEQKYQKNRHNAAWLLASSLDILSGARWQKKFKGEYTALEAGGERVYFLKPETYMNLSGESVGALAAFYKILPEQILIVHDELELPFGTIGLKWSGGLAGHNGLRSTRDALGTADFWRLRLGIGRPGDGNVSQYVLSDFTLEESALLPAIFSKAGELVHALTNGEPQKALAQWSKIKAV